MSRLKLLLILAVMPEEAFSWLILAMRKSAMTQGANMQIWPDGIGGFTHESRESINEIREAVEEYIKSVQ
jgi:hypothetical protein